MKTSIKNILKWKLNLSLKTNSTPNLWWNQIYLYLMNNLLYAILIFYEWNFVNLSYVKHPFWWKINVGRHERPLCLPWLTSWVATKRNFWLQSSRNLDHEIRFWHLAHSFQFICYYPKYILQTALLKEYVRKKLWWLIWRKSTRIGSSRKSLENAKLQLHNRRHASNQEGRKCGLLLTKMYKKKQVNLQTCLVKYT